MSHQRFARPRKNDPAGVVPAPAVSDQVPSAEVLSELQARLAHIHESYLFGKSLIDANPSFNQSLIALRKWNRAGDRKMIKPNLDVQLRFLIHYLARKHASAEKREGPITDVDRETAENEALQLLKPRRGRPRDDHLHRHIAGLMALIVESTGKAVHATRYKNYIYDPQPSDRLSTVVGIFFKKLDPTITDTRIANIILNVRRESRGRRMRFDDYFPFYGATITPF